MIKTKSVPDNWSGTLFNILITWQLKLAMMVVTDLLMAEIRLG
jgi:hypothetical protein